MDRSQLPLVDVADRRFWDDIHTPLREALAVAPIARTPEGGLLILGADELESVLRDPRCVTVDLLARGGIVDGPLHDWWSKVMFSTDPPEHTRLRRLVSRSFTPRRADEMSGRIAEITDEVLEPHLAVGHLDLVADVAHQIPIRVMGDMLAVPPDDYDTFARWTADLGLVFSSIVDPELRSHLEATVVELGDYVRTLIASRRSAPGDDLLSQLIEAEEAGDRLTEDELVALVMNLLFAGHDTTRSLLQIGWAVLAAHPAEARALNDDPDRAVAVVEEVLRWEPPVFGTGRAFTVDVEVADVSIAAGESLSFALPAANRDPRRYDDPDSFVPDRWSTGDVLPAIASFGQGVHYCLGAALARTEARVAMPRVLAALPDLALDASPEWVPYSHIRRYAALPARFTPRR